MLNKSIKIVVSLIAASFFVAAPANAIPLVNHALTGTASQSSTYSLQPIGSVASNAIDGSTNGIWVPGNSPLNSLTHTNLDKGAWWEVDLGQLVDIDSIVIWNRTDSCCTARMNDFSVWLDGLLIDTYIQNNGPTPSYTISNINMIGQVVRVALNDADYLHLAEVQVFGTADVPEPAPLALLGFGLLGLGLMHKRKA